MYFYLHCVANALNRSKCSKVRESQNERKIAVSKRIYYYCRDTASRRSCCALNTTIENTRVVDVYFCWGGSDHATERESSTQQAVPLVPFLKEISTKHPAPVPFNICLSTSAAYVTSCLRDQLQGDRCTEDTHSTLFPSPSVYSPQNPHSVALSWSFIKVCDFSCFRRKRSTVRVGARFNAEAAAAVRGARGQTARVAHHPLLRHLPRHGPDHETVGLLLHPTGVRGGLGLVPSSEQSSWAALERCRRLKSYIAVRKCAVRVWNHSRCGVIEL